MTQNPTSPEDYVATIKASGLSIYDKIPIGHPTLWIPTPQLEKLLHNGLQGLSLAGLPLRTRSKVVKENVCRVLGYPIPKSFKKTQPRFEGQFFDTYTQKSNNLQIWNEELSPSRRYVIIRVSDADEITQVKVVTGDTLAILDTTGTLTQKYQARCIVGEKQAELINNTDTPQLMPFVSHKIDLSKIDSPVMQPIAGHLLPVAEIFERLLPLIGKHFPDAGADQDRNRGAALHSLVCNALGYTTYQDDGQFPDVRHQLLEVKLQTSPTIDLGLVTPESTEPLDVPMLNGVQVRHCDVRYAIFYAKIEGGNVILTHLIVSPGADFFKRFPQFQGKVLNAKLQIPLPAKFFAKAEGLPD
jgi:hypothetical protein